MINKIVQKDGVYTLFLYNHPQKLNNERNDMLRSFSFHQVQCN